MQVLYEYMQNQLNAVPDVFKRYLYQLVDWNNRMLGLVGPRGVGKTTLFLQYIKESGGIDNALYVSADHMYFADHTLYEVAGYLYKQGISRFFIDEVHKYPSWSRELKQLMAVVSKLVPFKPNQCGKYWYCA